MGWAVPIAIIGGLVAIGVQRGPEAAAESATFWVLANGIPAAIGAIVALGHPLTVLLAFVSAPITSLSPVIGVGYLTGFLQAWLKPPLVRELSTVLDDIGEARGWWSNRLLRIVLVFFLTTVGSLIGTFVGGAEIVRNLAGA